MPSKSSRTSDVRDNDRVMVFIDGSNLYHVLSQSCGRHDLQFDKFALKLADGRKLQRIYYYNIRQESDSNPSVGAEQAKFLESLYDTPYVEVRLGIWKQRGDIMVEKGVDVMLATDLVTNAYNDHYDTAIVVSGDADFYPALQAVKDVGKHIEVAAFDMNLSSESARVADLVCKFNKTYFTGLWVTRAQAQSRPSSRAEVSDEAASPNGEDKAATKAATARRSSVRKPLSASRSSSSDTSTRTRRPAASRTRKSDTPEPSASDNRESTATPTTTDSSMRRTPTRRRVGGTNGSSSNDSSSVSRSAPRPPVLRTSVESTPIPTPTPTPAPVASKISSDADPVGSPTRRRNWRGRLGLNNTDDE